MSYSFVLPGFVEMIGRLATMDFGETKNLDDTDI
jgi:hypothetical protein